MGGAHPAHVCGEDDGGDHDACRMEVTRREARQNIEAAGAQDGVGSGERVRLDHRAAGVNLRRRRGGWG